MSHNASVAALNGLAIPRTKRHECVDRIVAKNHMQMETKYFRLSAEVALGSRFDDCRCAGSEDERNTGCTIW
jgi:hypothetical protein